MVIMLRKSGPEAAMRWLRLSSSPSTCEASTSRAVLFASSTVNVIRKSSSIPSRRKSPALGCPYCSQQVKTFASSSRQSFLPLFGLSRAQDTPVQQLRAFRLAVEGEDVDAVARTYSKIREYAETTSIEDRDETLSRADIAGALDLLARSAYVHRDLKLFKRIFDDASSLFGISLPSETSASYLDECQRLQAAAVPVISAQPTVEMFIDTMSAHSEGEVSLSDARVILGRYERESGQLLDTVAYQAAIARASDFTVAHSLYVDMQRDGLAINASILRRLIKLADGSAENCSMLQCAYEDLLDAPQSRTRSKEGVHDINLYTDLLLYCARPEVAGLKWSISLLEDARKHGLCFASSATITNSNPVTAADIVANVMCTCASNHSEAFKIYAWMLVLDYEMVFTTADFYKVIRTFTDLDFAGSNTSVLVRQGASKAAKRSWCPPSVYFAFFEDLRKAGLFPTSKIYQAVLHYYAREGKAHTGAAQNAVRQLHDVIKVDHYINPDIGLMNRLMYAHCRTGNLQGARGVWRAILLNKLPFDNVSISIIIDVYGYCGHTATTQLRDLWSSLCSQNFPLNKKNLESYVEALCRLGHETDAVQAVFDAPARDIEIDVRTLQILLKFVRGARDRALFEQTRQRIQTEFPDIWLAVAKVGTSASSAERQVVEVAAPANPPRSQRDTSTMPAPTVDPILV